MTGNPVSDQGSRLFVLDESLTPAVAEALKLVGYRFFTVEDVIGRKGSKDPEIIEWCKEYNAVWVHADDRARKQHAALLQTSGILTVLIHRTRGTMTGKEQLRILAFVLPQLIQNWEESPNVRHYRASAASPLAKPTLRAMTV